MSSVIPNTSHPQNPTDYLCNATADTVDDQLPFNLTQLRPPCSGCQRMKPVYCEGDGLFSDTECAMPWTVISNTGAEIVNPNRTETVLQYCQDVCEKMNPEFYDGNCFYFTSHAFPFECKRFALQITEHSGEVRKEKCVFYNSNATGVLIENSTKLEPSQVCTVVDKRDDGSNGIHKKKANLFFAQSSA